MQDNFKILVPALVLLLGSGCSKPAGEADIGMGIKPAPAATESQSAASSATAGSEALAPALLSAGEGETNRVITSCNLEQINGQDFGAAAMELSKAAPVVVNGWVMDQKGASDGVELRLINTSDAATHTVALTTNVARDDVAKALGTDAASVKPGFNATFSAKDLANGDYRLLLVVKSSANGAATCDNGRTISIVN